MQNEECYNRKANIHLWTQCLQFVIPLAIFVVSHKGQIGIYKVLGVGSNRVIAYGCASIMVHLQLRLYLTFAWLLSCSRAQSKNKPSPLLRTALWIRFFSIQPARTTATCSWWTERTSTRDEWKCVSTTRGEPFATTAGEAATRALFASSLGTLIADVSKRSILRSCYKHSCKQTYDVQGSSISVFAWWSV